MPDRTSIALACPQPVERATVVEWLTDSGYDPVPLDDLNRLDDSLQANPIEALIADRALLPRETDLSSLVRRLGSNRPLVVLDAPGARPGPMSGDISVIARPLTRESLLLSVGLALAEGRPVRRFPRRMVEPVTAVAHGLAGTVREASQGGVGLELTGRPSALPPYFRLRVPEFEVHVVVKRAWIAPAGPELLRCGGTVEGDLPDAGRPWAEFAREAPAPMAMARRRW